MSPTAISPTFEVYLPQDSGSKLRREREAFFRLLPQLLVTHPGQYVAVHDEQVVDSGRIRWKVRYGYNAGWVEFRSSSTS